MAEVPMAQNPQLIRSGLWRWSQGTGLERFELLRTDAQWVLRGTILALTPDGPAEARYKLACDALWRTRSAQISLRDACGERALNITASEGRWQENGQENTTVRGAIDIDLGWSPSTNTLPIRRLQLNVGQSSGAVVAAWVQFPNLLLQPLPQEYLRVSARVYRYTSRGGAFVAELSVDEDDLVLDYQGFWQRVRQEQEDKKK